MFNVHNLITLEISVHPWNRIIPIVLTTLYCILKICQQGRSYVVFLSHTHTHTMTVNKKGSRKLLGVMDIFIFLSHSLPGVYLTN